ncbi:hypothetical protein HDZ31DRAFT_75254 [Schizophyllum fasciatum]
MEVLQQRLLEAITGTNRLDIPTLVVPPPAAHHDANDVNDWEHSGECIWALGCRILSIDLPAKTGDLCAIIGYDACGRIIAARGDDVLTTPFVACALASRLGFEVTTAESFYEHLGRAYAEEIARDQDVELTRAETWALAVAQLLYEHLIKLAKTDDAAAVRKKNSEVKPEPEMSSNSAWPGEADDEIGVYDKWMARRAGRDAQLDAKVAKWRSGVDGAVSWKCGTGGAYWGANSVARLFGKRKGGSAGQ